MIDTKPLEEIQPSNPSNKDFYKINFINKDTDYKELKKLYLKANEENQENFYFKKQILVTKFAYYLLTFIEGERVKRGLKLSGKPITLII